MITYPLATATWGDEELQAMQRVIDSGRFTMGPEVAAFERDFAAHFGSRFAVMVNSGSSANLLAVASLVYHPEHPLRPGDTVIVPAVGWSTSYFPFQQYGLHLRFVDIDPDTLNIDPTLVASAITPETRAVLAVNLLGNPCDFEILGAICRERNLLLLEDNCESMGATYQGRHTGTFGVCGTFSTFFSHHISTMEGGVVVTDDEALYHTMLSMRAHGWIREQPPHSHLATEVAEFERHYQFVLPGYNLRPLELAGAIGREQLPKLAGMVAERRSNARRFVELAGRFEDIACQRELGESSWFGFALVLTGALRGRRAALVQAFREAGIECRPVVSGNFLRNPVLRHLDHSLGSEIVAADRVHDDGFFIGNHPYAIGDELALAERVLEATVRES